MSRLSKTLDRLYELSLKKNNSGANAVASAGPQPPASGFAYARANTAITAVVPAYNEAGRIGAVIAVLCEVEYLREIIVVDDGSTDGTAEAARMAAQGDPRVRVLHHPVNRGKGEALFTAFQAIRTPLVLMLDADLVSLKVHHVDALIEPVLVGRADMTLGLFRQGYWQTDATHWLTPWLTGQRCLRTDLLRSLDKSAAAGYGFETALTIFASHEGWRSERVPLVGMSHIPGALPQKGWRGPATKVKMIAHIGRAWLLAGYWRDLAERTMRRVRLLLLLALAFAVSIASNFSATAAGMPDEILIKWLSNETFWELWSKIKEAIDALQ